MKPALWRFCAHVHKAVLAAVLPLAVLLPHAASAQVSVTDPAATVPPVVYLSVFADTPKGVEMQTTDWKKANAEVGQFRRGHVDILKWEEANPSAIQTSAPSDITPPKPAPSSATQGGTPAKPAGAGGHKH